jgi:hypothetical protein
MHVHRILGIDNHIDAILDTTVCTEVATVLIPAPTTPSCPALELLSGRSFRPIVAPLYVSISSHCDRELMKAEGQQAGWQMRYIEWQRHHDYTVVMDSEKHAQKLLRIAQ